MQRKLIPLLLMLLLLCGCGKTAEEADGTRSVKVYGETYTVNDGEGTVSDGKYEYGFAVSANGKVTLSYPDGSSYWWQANESSGYGGWSDDYETRDPGYADGDKLYAAVTSTAKQRGGIGGSPIFAILLIGFGAVYAIAPETMWRMKFGWKLKDAEPSEASLTVTRALGIVFLLGGILILIF